MNLNFYQPDNNNYLENLRTALNDQINKLDQLKTVSLGQNNNVKPLQPQRYYLDCGIKEDWEEFLKINYGITEGQIFEDYRLFLQAKTELHEDENKEKLQQMKEKLAPKTKIKENRMKQYVGNNTNASNQSSNRNDKQAMETNNNNIQDKGVQHVR